MRPSVIAAWPIVCQRWEGVTAWMYLDTLGKVTTGTGNLIDTIPVAQGIEWVTKTGTIATDTEVAREWQRVKAIRPPYPNGLSSFWSVPAQLLLTRKTVDSLLFDITAEFWAHLLVTLPLLESYPADAQLAIMDEAWQNGKYFLDAGTVWKGTRAAVLSQNWAAAASHVPGTGARADFRKRLFNNAAKVVALKLDPSILWDTKTPTAPVVVTPPVVIPPVVVTPPVEKPPVVTPPPVVKPPAVTPPVKEVILSESRKVRWKGGRHLIDERLNAQLLEVERILGHAIVMYQGSWAKGSLSANTHAGAGAADIGPTGPVTWRQLELACRKVGLCAWFRPWANNYHVHVLSLGNDFLASWAKVQVRAYLDGYDGLGGNARASRDTGSRAFVKVRWESYRKANPTIVAKSTTSSKEDTMEWKRFVTGKDQKLAKGGKYQYLKVNDAGDVSFATGPCKLVSGVLDLEFAGLAPGQSAFVRLVEDDVNSKGQSKRIATKFTVEVPGTSGSTRVSIPFVGNVGSTKGLARRVRFEWSAGSTSVVVNNAAVAYFRG